MTSYSADQSAKRDHEMIEHRCGVGQGRSDDKVFTCLNQRVEMAKSCEYKIVYLSLLWLCGFYNPCIDCLSEYLHLRDLEPLVINAGFYYPSTAICPLVSGRYSLIVSCILYLL